MKNNRIQCQVCGSHNWSGALYCEKCSGELYHNHAEDKAAARIDNINKIFKLWE